MDELKDKDASVSRSDLGVSTVTVREHVDVISEIPADSMVCEAEVGKIEGSHEAGDGEDVMSEVVGSRVFVDGGCSHSSGVSVGGEEHLNDEEIRGLGGGRSAEVGVKNGLRSVSSVGDVVGYSAAKESGVSRGEASSSHGLEAGFEGPPVEETAARESFERIKEVVGSESAGSMADDMSAKENGFQNDEVHVSGNGNRVEGSDVDVGSTGGETQVVNDEDIEVLSVKDGLERGLSKDAVERGSGADFEARGSRAENVVGPSTVVSGTVSEETQIVEEEDDNESENAVAKELVKGAEKAREMDAAGEDAHQDVDTPYLGSCDVETQNPGSGIAFADSLTTDEFSSVRMQVVDEAAVMVSDKEMNPDVDAAGVDSVEGITSSSEEKKIPFAEAGNTGTGKDSVISAHYKSLDEQNPVAIKREIPEMDKEEFMCSTMEGMENDSFDENLSFSLEELQGNFGRVDGSTENHCNVYADSLSFCHPAQAFGSEGALKNKKVHPDEHHQQLQLEECSDQGTAHNVAHVDSNTTQAMEIDEQVTTAELDEMLSCSGNVQNFKDGKMSTNTDLDTEATDRGDGISLMNNQGAVNSNVKVQMTTGTDEQLKLKERLDKSQDCHFARPLVPSIVGKDMVVGQQINDAEHVNSIVENEMDVRKQIISEVVGGEVTATDGKVSSNPTVEVPYFSVQVKNEGEGMRTAENAAGGLSEVDSTVGHEWQVEEQVPDAERDDLHGEQKMEVEDHDSDTEQPETNEEKFVYRETTTSGSLVKSHQGSYLLPLENGEFYVSDLVWGKVRSHPWWPGRIFDPSDASEKAMKYYKEDCFLIAYFGDRTFAWVDASQLKPFYSHFSQVEKQSNAEGFQNAVSCALEEVSRRVELGLACPCIPNDAYDEIRLQFVENAGIRQESSVREGVDKSASAQYFQPNKLVEYMKTLALSPSGGADRLELVIAKAQLLSFYRSKGYIQLPWPQFCGELVEDDVDTSQVATPVSKDDELIYTGHGTSENQRSSYHKRKHNLKGCTYPGKKEKSLSELMTGSFDSLDDDEFDSDVKSGGKVVSPSSSKKRKVVDFAGDGSSQDGRKTISLAKVCSSTPNIPKPSFKIGECIRRVASQMTGSPSLLKSNSERMQKLIGDGFDVPFENFEDDEGKRVILPTDYATLDDLLSQLHLAARDPVKGYGFLNIVISFFSDFRNSMISDKHALDKLCGKRKKSSQILGSPETFEFEDMSDTYWTDRVIQNGAEEQASAPPAPAATDKNSPGYQIVPVDLKPVQKSRRSYSKKQNSNPNHDLTPPKPPGCVDENSPAELVINFSEVDTIPSETNLNKMFRHFGPLKESETEVDRESCRARVVFKKCSDAEVAHSSASKFNIFGPMVVNYQISYTISEPFKASPNVTSMGEEYAT